MHYLLAFSMGVLSVVALFGCDRREVVVVYSPHGAEVLGDYETRFEKANPKLDLQWITAGAQEVYARVKNERYRPACDVWWGAPATLFMRAVEDDLLEPVQPDWAQYLDDNHKDAQGRWHATYISPIASLFNTSAYSREDMPASWDDLLDSKWDQKIAIRKPLASGTMRTFFSGMIMRQPSVDEGIDWLARLHAATGRYPEQPNLLYDHVKKNPERISVWLLPDIVMQRDRHGFPFDFHVPPQTPVLPDGIALVKGGPNPEGARIFFDFVTTEEALIQQARDYAKMPARTDIDPAKLPDWMTTQKIDALPMDWAALAVNEEAWLERWEREVLRAP
jgi:iron(III) transport system substrate-binding protein